jgi:hypothetical protein
MFSALSVVLLVLGRPERLSSTGSPSALKRECHSKIAVRLKESSPKAFQVVSAADLSSFTQNLMQTRY